MIRPSRALLRIALLSAMLLLASRSWASDSPPPRGYTIPLLDLSGEGTRRIVVDREPGQYLGHVTTAMLDDGRTIFAVYPKGHGGGAIVLKRSDDGGLTWSERLPTPPSWATSKEVPTLYRVSDPLSGGRRFILFSGLNPIRIASSDDDGRTWSELDPIGEYGGIVATASLAQREDGTLVTWFHDDGRFIRVGGGPRGFRVYQIESRDGGRTWSEPIMIARHESAHLCEPGLVISPHGEAWLLLLRENSRKHNSFAVFSADEGRSWGEPREMPGAITGDRHTAVRASDGRLFISFRDTTHESETQGDWVAWVGTWRDLAEGRQGQYRVRLADNLHRWDCAYPGVEILPDGTIVATTYGHWDEGQEPYIVSVRLRLEELDELAR